MGQDLKQTSWEPIHITLSKDLCYKPKTRPVYQSEQVITGVIYLLLGTGGTQYHDTPGQLFRFFPIAMLVVTLSDLKA